MSSTIWWLILGLLIGWLIAWVIDWVYWRRRRQEFDPRLRQARADAERLESRLKAMGDADQRYQAEIAALRGQLGEAGLLRDELKAAGDLAGQHEAEIAALRGRLGEVDSLRVQAADIGRLRADLQAAVDRADQREAEIATLREQLASATAVEAPAALAAETEAAPKDMRFATVQLSREELEAQLAGVADGQPAPDTSRQTVLLSAADLADADRLQAREVARPARRDPLIDINGIGPAYERRLVEAGVNTFEELAALTPEQIRAIIKPERWQEIHAEAWIAEARERAQK